MTMNKQAFKLAGVTEAEYKRWCKDNHKAAYKAEVKEDFFARIQDGRLVRDERSGKLVKKYRKENNSP